MLQHRLSGNINKCCTILILQRNMIQKEFCKEFVKSSTCCNVSVVRILENDRNVAKTNSWNYLEFIKNANLWKLKVLLKNYGLKCGGYRYSEKQKSHSLHTHMELKHFHQQLLLKNVARILTNLENVVISMLQGFLCFLIVVKILKTLQHLNFKSCKKNLWKKSGATDI